ncbi:MAG TPA: zinc ribbon domain-containing protein [Chloroflexia bacterium]
MICVHCGQELPDTANFCLHCGRRPAMGNIEWRWVHRYTRPIIGLLILFIGFLLLMYFDVIPFNIDLLNTATRIFWILLVAWSITTLLWIWMWRRTHR